MKMGLSMVLVGHVNFLLGALVHGVVLRHINLHKQARAMEYAISNVVALTSGLVGIVVGILGIVLSKNKKSRGLTWSLFSVSLASSLLAAASAIGLLVSVVRAIMHGGRSLLTHCRFPDAIGYSSITNECPFDPTRIYSTTLILWVPLIVTCGLQLIFSARLFSVCVSFLGLACRPRRRRPREARAVIRAVRSLEELDESRVNKAKRHDETPPPLPNKRYTEAPRSYSESKRSASQPVRQQRARLPRNTTGASPPQRGCLFARSLAGKARRGPTPHKGASGGLRNNATCWRGALWNDPVSGYSLKDKDCFLFHSGPQLLRIDHFIWCTCKICSH
ncbi:transmembrane protein 54-like isoform X2 [Syngnathoides biaculeatus]|nr:transmembrane protein 54-like isoform X2 [Syngnathoides biaculeatus]